MSLDLAISDQDRLTVKRARSAGEVERIRRDWLALQKHPHADLDFNLMLATVRDEIESLHAVRILRGGALKSLMVGRIEERRIPFKIGYKTVSRPMARILAVPRGGILGEKSGETARLQIAEILRILKKGDVDAVILSLLRTDSPLFQETRKLSALFSGHSLGSIERNYRVALPGDIDAFILREKAKHRRELRRYGRVLERHFARRVKYKCYQTADHVPTLCADAEEISKKSYQRGINAGFILNTESERKLYLWAEKQALRGYVLSIDAKPIAYWIGALYGSTFFLDTTGYDPVCSKYNPGTVLYLRMVEDLCRLGVGEIDNGIGDSFWKKRFGAEGVDKSTVFVYAPTMKGLRLKATRVLTTSISSFAKRIARRTSMKRHIVKLARHVFISRARRKLGAGR